jgi:hypothetical protein
MATKKVSRLNFFKSQMHWKFFLLRLTESDSESPPPESGRERERARLGGEQEDCHKIKSFSFSSPSSLFFFPSFFGREKKALGVGVCN